jgi:hypothetical protein
MHISNYIPRRSDSTEEHKVRFLGLSMYINYVY